MVNSQSKERLKRFPFISSLFAENKVERQADHTNSMEALHLYEASQTNTYLGPHRLLIFSAGICGAYRRYRRNGDGPEWGRDRQRKGDRKEREYGSSSHSNHRRPGTILCPSAGIRNV